MHKTQIIGRKDKVDFPEWGISNIPVKVDTGAYTSSIHCESAQLSNGGQTLTAIVGHNDHLVEIATTEFEKKSIKSSSGVAEERFIVKTKIRIFEEEHSIVLSLNRRDTMKTPVLLGRQLLNQHFIVDTRKTNLSFKHKNSKK